MGDVAGRVPVLHQHYRVTTPKSDGGRHGMQRCECHSSLCKQAACVPPFTYGGACSRAGLLHRGGRARGLRTVGPGKLRFVWALIGGAHRSTCLPPFTVANRFWSDVNPVAALRGWYEERVLTTLRRWAATVRCGVARAAERAGGRPRAGPRNVLAVGAPVGWHEGETDPSVLGSRAEVLSCACCRAPRRPAACGAMECLCYRCPCGVARESEQPHDAVWSRRGAALRLPPSAPAAARVCGHKVGGRCPRGAGC